MYNFKHICRWCGGRWLIRQWERTSKELLNRYTPETKHLKKQLEDKDNKLPYFHKWCYLRHLICDLDIETPQTFTCIDCGRQVKEKMRFVEDCSANGEANGHRRSYGKSKRSCRAIV